MKILFVCHRVPYPPTRGGKIRPFNIIRHFTENGHEVTVASLARSEREREEASELKQYCAAALVEVVSSTAAAIRTVARLPTASPSSFGYFHSPRLERRISAQVRNGGHDLIFVHCSSAASYVSRLQVPYKVLDFGDMDSHKWREYARFRPFPLALGYALEAVKVERAERRLAVQFDLCTCTTAAEYARLRGLGTGRPADWFPNGVDSDFFRPTDRPYDVNVIAFIGRMDYYPNQGAMIGFCRDVFPRLRALRPRLQLRIVGADPSARVRALGGIPGVSVTGSVADVRPYVLQAALTVAPLQIACGTQNKILESMAMGVPVVCSEQAAGGVDGVPGVHLLTATDSTGYVDAIMRVLESPRKRDALSQAARSRILANHSWNSSMRRLDEMLRRLKAQRKSGVSIPPYSHNAIEGGFPGA